MTPTTLRPRLLATAVLAAGLGLPGAVAQAAPTVSVAPGRIAFATDGGGLVDNVDAGGASLATALPGGATLMIGNGQGGMRAAKVNRDGTLDPSFGSGGVVPMALPPGASYVSQLLRQADGKLLLVSLRQQPSNGGFAPGQLQVTRLNADATIDSSYGDAGTVATGLTVSGGAALQTDGALLLTGATGDAPPTPAGPNFRWAVTRVTPAGVVDSGFGTSGIATIPTTISTTGFNVAPGPGGSVVVEGQSQTPLNAGSRAAILLTRLTATGAPDPTFAAGSPIATPFASGRDLLVQDDGSIMLDGQPQPDSSSGVLSLITPRMQFLARYGATGAPDTTFGSGGILDLGAAIMPTQLLPFADGGVLVVGTPEYGLAPGTGPTPGRLNARVVTAGGAIAQDRTVDVPFGGGGSSFLVSKRPRPVGSLSQNSFSADHVVRRSDGSYIVPGGVSVSQPTGEGVGFSIGRFAAAALTPSFELDPSFGGSAAPLRLSVSLPRQRAATAHTRHGIRISLRSTAVGLARVKVLHGDRAIALSLLPVFTTGRQTLPVELTKYGNTYLRHHRNLRVTVSASARDLVATTIKASARGRLR